MNASNLKPTGVPTSPETTVSAVAQAQKPNRLLKGMTRGVRGRCPNCGEGKLFKSYLKVIPICAACGNNNGQYPSDDGPPYFTIVIVGHLIIAPLIAFRTLWTLPITVLLAVLLPTVLTLTLTLLPIVKGAVIGVLWVIATPEVLKDTRLHPTRRQLRQTLVAQPGDVMVGTTLPRPKHTRKFSFGEEPTT